MAKSERSHLGRADWLLACGLALAAVAYLASLPLDVVTPPDEAHVLHQAKRLLGGEVLYRDLFDLTTPLWTYLMAGLFRLFGTTLATARLTVAVVHGATLLVMFVLCRRLGVRRELAAIAALGELALCQPVYPVANRHWLVTLLCLVLLLHCVAGRRGVRADLLSGVLVGTIVAAHQQRGVAMSVALVVWLVAGAWLDRRHRAAPAASLAVSLAAVAAGVAAVVVPTLALVTWKAGVRPVWYALVVHPLTNYYGTLRATWGGGGSFTRRTTLPALLKSLPVVLVPVALRLAVLTRSRRGVEEARELLALLVLCGFAPLSVFYYPDLAHLAFIAPLFFVAAALVAEWVCRLAPQRWGTVAARVAVALVAAVTAGRLATHWRSEHRHLRAARVTAFGRVDFSPPMAQRYDDLERLLAGRKQRVLYVHPFSSFHYLMLGARNPTRFEFLYPGKYNTDEQTREVLAALRPENGIYVIFPLRPRRADPVARYVQNHYEPVEGLVGVWRPILQTERRHGRPQDQQSHGAAHDRSS